MQYILSIVLYYIQLYLSSLFYIFESAKHRSIAHNFPIIPPVVLFVKNRLNIVFFAILSKKLHVSSPMHPFRHKNPRKVISALRGFSLLFIQCPSRTVPMFCQWMSTGQNTLPPGNTHHHLKRQIQFCRLL